MRSLIAALAAAVTVCLSGALALLPGYAQDNPPVEAIDNDPNAGGSPDTAVPAGAPADTTAAPAGAEAAVPAPTAATPNPSPVVAAIRAKLQDPALRSGIPADDLAALVAFYDSRDAAVWTTDMGFSSEAQAVIDEILEADEWGLSSSAFKLPDAGDLPGSPEEQAAAEILLDIAILKYARHARGGRIDPAKLKNIDMRPTLLDPKVMLTEISVAPEPGRYLQSLHPKHEQFERLHQALLKARAESEAGAKPANMQKILVNMERWRWMPPDLGSFYVWLNIPEFMVYIVKNGKTIHSEKIVVGKPVYATPVFSADLKSIVFNPEWTVPSTIIREDLLPRLRGGGGFFSSNTAILKQHKLSVRYNGKKVDPGSIDWNRVNMAAISFHQDPGPTNVLGKVKFLYPNRHSVYMHDTIKRELLTREVRAEGHHCPRVANPGKVAAIILAENKGLPQSEVDKLLADGYNSGVSINGRVPVHTTYFTVTVDEEGKLRAFNDVYGMDGPTLAALLGKETKPEAVADNADMAAPAAEVKPKPKPKPQAKPSTIGSASPAAGFGAAAP
ncbi:MAG TPA: L,D-transpeptidase family protein [Methyloceanibacter sp.]|nr:L,D-transpeptidase family protein [Methyloceanibacter sp.]